MAPTAPTEPYVLVADDDPDMRRLLRTGLEARGFRVETADNGWALAQRLVSNRGRQPDAIVTDVQMPGMGGVEALTRVRARGLQIPAILVTAYPHPGLYEQAHILGVVGILQKPFRVQELGELVARQTRPDA